MPDVTELTALDIDEVHLVGKGANGFPSLIMKEAQEAVEAAAKGDGFHSTDTESPEADVIEGDLTTGDSPDDGSARRDNEGEFAAAKEAAQTEAEVEYVAWVEKSELDEATKAKLKAADRKALPDSDFAYIDSKGGRHLPIPDEDHVRAALGRFSEQHFESKDAKRKAARKIKSKAKTLGIKLSDAATVSTTAAKSPGVPDFATETPKIAGQMTSESHSGLGPPMTSGVRHPHSDPSFALGGESTYNIPAEGRIDQSLVPNIHEATRINRPNGAEAQKAEEGEDLIHVVEKADYLTLANPTAAESTTPGSPTWEDYDAASLDEVAHGLAACARAVDAIQKRETIEAVSGNPSDWEDAADLSAAGDAINGALAFVARLAYHEASAGVQKSGRRLSASSESHIRAARDHLTHLLGDGGETHTGPSGTKPSEEEEIMATVTKEELFAEMAKAAESAARKAVQDEFARTAKEAKKEAKRQRKLTDKATKNANNGGDISAADMERQVHGHFDANDVNAVGDGTDPQYVNASNDPRGSASKESKVKGGKALKAMASQLRETRELVEKMASRPRSGGPVLDGVARGAFPANGSRQVEAGQVAKSEADVNIERLEKAVESTDPVAKAEASQMLTYWRLIQAHEAGQI